MFRGGLFDFDIDRLGEVQVPQYLHQLLLECLRRVPFDLNGNVQGHRQVGSRFELWDEGAPQPVPDFGWNLTSDLVTVRRGDTGVVAPGSPVVGGVNSVPPGSVGVAAGGGWVTRRPRRELPLAPAPPSAAEGTHRSRS